MDLRDWIRGPELKALRCTNKRNQLELIDNKFRIDKLSRKLEELHKDYDSVCDNYNNSFRSRLLDNEKLVKELKSLKWSMKFLVNDLKDFAYFKKAWAKHQVRVK